MESLDKVVEHLTGMAEASATMYENLNGLSDDPTFESRSPTRTAIRPNTLKPAPSMLFFLLKRECDSLSSGLCV